MNKIMYVVLIICTLSCKKDGISFRDKKNDCKDCPADIVDGGGNKIGELEYTEYPLWKTITPSSMRCEDCKDYCDYLMYLSDKFKEDNTDSSQGIEIIIKCP